MQKFHRRIQVFDVCCIEMLVQFASQMMVSVGRYETATPNNQTINIGHRINCHAVLDFRKLWLQNT